jgi:hypothetical protein
MGYRDPTTGFHTNDAESENSRLKKWSRHRYGKLNITTNEMNEYVFYSNVGSGLFDILKGMAVGGGGLCRNSLLVVYNCFINWVSCALVFPRVSTGHCVILEPQHDAFAQVF